MRVTWHPTEAVWDSKVSARGKARLTPSGSRGAWRRGAGGHLSAQAAAPLAAWRAGHPLRGRAHVTVTAPRRSSWRDAETLSPSGLTSVCTHAHVPRAHQNPKRRKHPARLTAAAGAAAGAVRPTSTARGAAADHAPHPRTALPALPALRVVLPTTVSLILSPPVPRGTRNRIKLSPYSKCHKMPTGP